MRVFQDSATASQYQSAFKVNVDCCSYSCDRCWCWYWKSRWISLVKIEWPSSRCCHCLFKNPSGNPKADGGINRWTTLYKRSMTVKAKTSKSAYMDVKCMAKHVVWLAKSEAEKEESATVSQDGDGVFCITKQMDHTNQDVVGDNCVCSGVYTKFSCRLSEEPFTWLIQKFPCILIF